MTKIEWLQDSNGTKGKSWNPVTGCTPISEGCRNCYAKRMATRLKGRFGYPADDPFRVTFHPDRLDEPLKWKKPKRIFVCSMGDLFHEDVKSEWRIKTINKMYLSIHTFIILTKRPDNMQKFFKCFNWPGEFQNVWLGVTAENQAMADERIPILLQIPAAIHFISVEPMLGPINLFGDGSDEQDWTYNGPDCLRPHIGWLICGAETGPGKRIMDLEWAYDLQRQCGDAGVPFFFKKDSDGEYPAGFRREYPRIKP
jgi:protein gp37